jgi:hypothetical protein
VFFDVCDFDVCERLNGLLNGFYAWQIQVCEATIRKKFTGNRIGKNLYWLVPSANSPVTVYPGG